jgi:hypothetical protein
MSEVSALRDWRIHPSDGLWLQQQTSLRNEIIIKTENKD